MGGVVAWAAGAAWLGWVVADDPPAKGAAIVEAIGAVQARPVRSVQPMRRAEAFIAVKSPQKP